MLIFSKSFFLIHASPITVIEIGSGSSTSPSNKQNLGSNFPNAQVRLDLTLPANVYLTNGALTDIKGEFALISDTTIQIIPVFASSILYKKTMLNGTQNYVIKFPPSQYLPIRRLFINLKAQNNPTENAKINTLIRTTFNSTFSTLDYGWKPASP